MKKTLLFLLVQIIFIQIITAQVTQPVQLSFDTKRLNDSTALLNVHVKINDSTQIFAVKNNAADNPFASQLQLDTASSTYIKSTDSIIEAGNAIIIKDSAAGINAKAYTGSATFTYTLHINAKDTFHIKGIFSWLGKKADAFPSGQDAFKVTLYPVNTPASKQGNNLTDKSLSGIFWICLGVGLGAILTPCVFPLIPVTVSFFLKRSKSKSQGIANAAWYSLSIILIYTIPTILLTKIFGDTVLYSISTHPVTNLLFFLIFIVFGISLLGAFEIMLPSKWANVSDQQAGKGGWKGIFFMALTLVIVSFSCTGPIVGALLGSTSKGGTLAPVIGMLGFGVGLAFPFTIFALFPSLMQSLPKSGGWLNSVKVVFGFIELALALKFLSNVDLIYHWRLLDREVFLCLWITIAFLLGLYLLGKIKFSHDSDMPYVSLPRLFFAIATFAFALYLIPGLWGAPLRAMSGFIPPTTTQDFNLDELQYKIGSASSAPASNNNEAKQPQKLTDKLHAPFGISAYFDLDEGMAAAKALNKPVMLDFTGHSCANCRKMEEQVWKDAEVLKRIKSDFVLISLYVDEPTELADNEKYTNANGDKVNTVGEKYLDYEITKFGFNAQPLYMFLDLNGNILSDVKYGYDPDIQKFINHLDAVKKAFYKQ
jgi:thiol:disulfide interchange protein DsbD